MKFLKWLDEHFEETLLIILLIMISCVELLQVIVRNVSWFRAFTWPEEFCRFCWIWSVFLSLPYTIRKAGMLRVSVLLDFFPDKGKKMISIIVDLLTAACMLILGINSIEVVRKIMASGETSPAMVWPMWIVYSIMIVGFTGGFLRGMQQVCLHVRGFNDRLPGPANAAEEAEAGIRAEGEKA